MTPWQTMDSEDVPDDLLRLARTAGDAYDRTTGGAFTWEGYREAILAAVLPTAEAVVRAKIAEQMQAVWDEAREKVAAYGTTYPVDAVGKCIQIARGEA